MLNLINYKQSLYSSRKCPYPPQGMLTEIPGERRVPKAQFFNGKYGA